MKVKFEELMKIAESIDRDMVFIPKGSFPYGISKKKKKEIAKKADIHPDMLYFHSDEAVLTTDNYWIDRYPITKAQFIRFMRETGYKIQYCGWQIGWMELNNNLDMKKLKENGWEIDWKQLAEIWDITEINNGLSPVIGINYEDASTYVKWLKKRLPTEIEWEKAGRGKDGRLFPWGNEWEESKCFRNLGNIPLSSNSSNLPVGSFSNGASPYGVMDMAGSVMEWVKRIFPSISKNGEQIDDQPFVLTGGSIFHNQIYSHMLTSRFSWSCYMRIYNSGFRCVSDDIDFPVSEIKLSFEREMPKRMKVSLEKYLNEPIKIEPMDWQTVKIFVPYFPSSVWVLDTPESRWGPFPGANDWPFQNSSFWEVKWEKDGNVFYYNLSKDNKELRFEIMAEENLVKYKVKGVEGQLGSFCLKTLSPFFSNQERLTQCKFKNGKLISCIKMPIEDSANLSFLWSVGEIEDGVVVYRCYDNDSFVVIFGPGGSSAGGNLWPPCTHIRGKDTKITDEMESAILFFIGSVDKLKKEIRRIRKKLNF